MAKIDMTEGNDISNKLVRYSLPLIIGNLFQLGYNLIDSIIAGRFIGKEALAAEGIASPVMNIVILSISGLSIGTGVLMSEFFGAKDYRKLKEELSTTLIFGCLFSVIAIVVCFVALEPLLLLLRVPEDIYQMTKTYLKIIFLGVPFTYFYNTLAISLKSIGDSRTPLKFLMFASVLNAVLDIIFLGYFKLGIICSATTTVVAEAVSACLSVMYIYRKIDELALKREDIVVNTDLLKKTLSYGLATALQQTIQPVCKLFIQRCVNGLGVDVIAAYNAVTRVDDFAYTPEQSIASGITTFVAQNKGMVEKDIKQQELYKESNINKERIYKGFRTGLKLEAGYWLVLFVTVQFFKKPLMSLFVEENASAEVIEIGVKYLTLMAFLYLFPAFTNGVQGLFRGLGRMKTTVLSTFIQASVRTIVSFMLTEKFGIYGISYGCAIGWSLMLLFEVPYYFILKSKNKLL